MLFGLTTTRGRSSKALTQRRACAEKEKLPVGSGQQVWAGISFMHSRIAEKGYMLFGRGMGNKRSSVQLRGGGAQLGAPGGFGCADSLPATSNRF